MSTCVDHRPLVAHLIDELPIGGAERLIVDLLRYPNPRFRYVVVCVIRTGPMESELRNIGIPVIVFGRRGRLDFGLVFRLSSWMKRERVRIVHTHLFTADAYGRLAARIAGVPGIFSTVHSIANPWKNWIHRLVDRVFARISTRVIGCSDEVAEVLRTRDRLPPSRVVAIQNGIDLNRVVGVPGNGIREELGIEQGRLLMAIIGRLHEPKGHVDLLAALAAIPAELRSNLSCLIVGDGELRGLVEHEIQRLGLSDWVQLTGIRRDIPQLLAELDIFVMSSRWEGLPISLLEAMANGVACVSTAVGGVPGVIRNGYNGVLVEPRNTSALATGLLQLLLDKDLRQRLGAQAKNDVFAHYDVRNTATAYHEQYMAALGIDGTNAGANDVSSGI